MDISFKGVTPLVGKQGSFEKLQKSLTKQFDNTHPDYTLIDVTRAYTTNSDKTNFFRLVCNDTLKDDLEKLAVQGKNKIMLLLTGKDVNKAVPISYNPSSYINNGKILLDNLSEALEKVIKLIKS
jgi:hypothetical protein